MAPEPEIGCLSVELSGGTGSRFLELFGGQGCLLLLPRSLGPVLDSAGPTLFPRLEWGMSNEAEAMAVFQGVVTHVSGERGVIKHVTHSQHGEISGALVRLDECPAFVYVSLGMRALTCTCGAEPLRREHHHGHCNLVSNLSTHFREVLGWREIDRDEFDRLTGIASLRAEFGWDLG